MPASRVRNPSLPLVAALGAGQIVAWGSSYYLPAILAPSMARDLGVSSDFVFAAFSGALLIAAVLGPVVGRGIDRSGGRNMLCQSNLVFAAALGLLATASNPGMLAAGWLILGAGMAMGLYEAAFAALTAHHGVAARGAITGVALFGGFASTVSWPVSAALDAHYGWRAACLFWAALQLFIGFPLHLLVPRGISFAPRAAERTPVTSRRNPGRAMVLLGFVFAVTWFISTAMASHLPRLLRDGGVPGPSAILASALIGPAQVAARLVEFGLLRRAHPLLSARLASLAHPLGAALFLLGGAPFASLFAVLHGAGNGVLTISKGTLPLVFFGPTDYGLRQGILTVPARIAQAAAPFAFALCIDRFGTASLFLSSALAIAGLLALLALPAAAPALTSTEGIAK